MTPNIKKLVKKLQSLTEDGNGLEAKIEIANYFGFEQELVELKELAVRRDHNDGMTSKEYEQAYNILCGMIEKLKAFSPKVGEAIYNAL